MLEVYFMWTESDLNVEIWKMYAKVFRRQWLWLVYKLSVIIIITNEKIKAMLLWKRCRGTLQDYNKGEISKCQITTNSVQSAAVWWQAAAGVDSVAGG